MRPARLAPYFHLTETASQSNMKYNPKYHHRRSIRLPEYDYSQSGIYFITICTYKKQCLFGEIHQVRSRSACGADHPVLPSADRAYCPSVMHHLILYNDNL